MHCLFKMNRLLIKFMQSWTNIEKLLILVVLLYLIIWKICRIEYVAYITTKLRTRHFKLFNILLNFVLFDVILKGQKALSSVVIEQRIKL